MSDIKFQWNDNKNKINQKKHKISFEEAQSVFFDEEALIIDDPEHSLEEERFIILGLSKKANLLVSVTAIENPIQLYALYLQEKLL